MSYEILVHHNGKHVFATHPRSVTTEQGAKEVAELLRASLPAGYVVEVSRVVTTHQTVAL